MENRASAVAADAAAKPLREAVAAIEDRPGLPTFTDSHHNLLSILKR